MMINMHKKAVILSKDIIIYSNQKRKKHLHPRGTKNLVFFFVGNIGKKPLIKGNRRSEGKKRTKSRGKNSRIERKISKNNISTPHMLTKNRDVDLPIAIDQQIAPDRAQKPQNQPNPSQRTKIRLSYKILPNPQR